MKLLVRQTYTFASLILMVPAAVWAALSYETHNFMQAIQLFPFLYLLFCQIAIIPRYVGAAWVVQRLSRYTAYDGATGAAGFIAAGAIADAWLIAAITNGVMQPSEENWTALVPFLLFPYALGFMLFAALVTGFAGAALRRRRVTAAKASPVTPKRQQRQ